MLDVARRGTGHHRYQDADGAYCISLCPDPWIRQRQRGTQSPNDLTILGQYRNQPVCGSNSDRGVSDRAIEMKIVSGGQTGADRGGLDAAIALGIAHGGWCPKGRKAEDGQVPACYSLAEARSADYRVRTKLNVRDSDATVIFTRGPLTG